MLRWWLLFYRRRKSSFPFVLHNLPLEDILKRRVNYFIVYIWQWTFILNVSGVKDTVINTLVFTDKLFRQFINDSLLSLAVWLQNLLRGYLKLPTKATYNLTELNCCENVRFYKKLLNRLHNVTGQIVLIVSHKFWHYKFWRTAATTVELDRMRLGNKFISLSVYYKSGTLHLFDFRKIVKSLSN